MIDIHPPHQTVHTWRDFFIHMITIILGLVIAIGLEQSIEALHRRHQRHQLEAQLRDEAQRNLDLVQQNLERIKLRRAWLNAAIIALNSAPVTQGHILRSVLPPPGDIFGVDLSQPSQTVWAVAKANGTVALLPEDEAQVYARLDYEGDELNIGSNDLKRGSVALLSARRRQQGRSASELQYISIAERDNMLVLLSDAAAQHTFTLDLELNEGGACRGVLHAARSVDEMLHFMLQEDKQRNNY